MKAKNCLYLIAVCFLGSGCAAHGELDKDFGRSYNRARTGQIQNPAASRNLTPVTGLPGEAADLSVQKYISSFARDPKNTGQKGNSAPGATTGGQDSHGK